MGSLPQQADIPIIDISSRNKNAASELLDAASRYGFVFIENDATDGIPAKDIEHMFVLSKKFFASPEHVKKEVSIHSNQAGENHGWLSRGVEKLDPKTQKRADVKEALNLPAKLNLQRPQALPAPLRPHISDIIAFQSACLQLCQRLLARFAEALQLEGDWFAARHGGARSSSSVFRLLWYPCASDAEEGVDVRAGAHSDYGSLTLLFQRPGQPGLEIRTPEGEWEAVPVDPRRGAVVDGEEGRALPILVNIGDLLEDWTGGLLRSTVHRVVFPRGAGSEDRYSIAYFCHPVDDAELVPVPSELVREHAAKTGKDGMRNGRVITARDHLMERLAATYTV